MLSLAAHAGRRNCLRALPSTYSFSTRTRLPGALTHAAPRMSEIHAKLREARTNPLTAALAFVLDRPEVDIVVIGVTSVAELDQIIDAAIGPNCRSMIRSCSPLRAGRSRRQR
jgi:aryl-alcohol dehydrogenase-like predicted oxidoreductase